MVVINDKVEIFQKSGTEFQKITFENWFKPEE